MGMGMGMGMTCVWDMDMDTMTWTDGLRRRPLWPHSHLAEASLAFQPISELQPLSGTPNYACDCAPACRSDWRSSGRRRDSPCRCTANDTNRSRPHPGRVCHWPDRKAEVHAVHTRKTEPPCHKLLEPVKVVCRENVERVTHLAIRLEEWHIECARGNEPTHVDLEADVEARPHELFISLGVGHELQREKPASKLAEGGVCMRPVARPDGPPQPAMQVGVVRVVVHVHLIPAMHHRRDIMLTQAVEAFQPVGRSEPAIPQPVLPVKSSHHDGDSASGVGVARARLAHWRSCAGH
eukprot:339568-Prymnesium_polylepis.1